MRACGRAARGTYTSGMQATIYDGHTWKPCSVADAQAAMKDSSLSWIDIRLDAVDDTGGAPIMEALGVDPSVVLNALKAGQGTDFTISPTGTTGAAWLAGDAQGAPEHARFDFDTHRLVTVRVGGDTAFTEVQSALEARAGLAINQPSRLLGFVLQAMQATLQQALTDMSIVVSVLDMEIITTADPSAPQSQKLVGFRQTFQPFATRFPSYVINVNAALLDPDTITGIDQAGVKELQSFATVSASTEGMIESLVDAIKAAVQDLQGQITNWQGQRINQLTIVTIIFLPITFLTGYFGMNFQWIDNLIVGPVAFFTLGVALPILLLGVSVLWLVRRGYQVSLGSPKKTSARKASSP